jgi:predicted amidohydrolase
MEKSVHGEASYRRRSPRPDPAAGNRPRDHRGQRDPLGEVAQAGVTRRLDKPFARVGVLHCVNGHADPVEALKDAISEHGDISNSLLVLPEAFNSGEPYYDDLPNSVISAHKILDRLSVIAVEHDIVLVAGVLEPPRNSAYLIDSNGPRLMGYKGADCGADNPIELNAVCIGALICSDAQDRFSWLMEKFEKSRCPRKIICIPASMSSSTFTSDRFVLPAYREKYVALANANLLGCGSFFANMAGTKVNFKGSANKIFLKTWSDLDDLHEVST